MATIIQKMQLLRAFVGLLNDPTTTNNVFKIAEVGLKSDPDRARLVIDTIEKDAGFRELWARRYFPRLGDLDELGALPEGTLGRAFADHMRTNDLTVDFFPEITDGDTAAYIINRIRHTHDIMHVITGYGTDVDGEIALQAFGFSQTNAGLSALIVAGGLFHVLKEHAEGTMHTMEMIHEGFDRGRKAKLFLGYPIEDHWETPLEEVRAALGVVPRWIDDVADPVGPMA